MKKFYIVGVVLLGLCLGWSSGEKGECTKRNRCSCTYDDGLIVDLRGVAKTDGSAEWKNVSNSEGQLFTWNPCYNFDLTFNRNDSECLDVAVCMLDTRGVPNELIYGLGSEETGVFSVDENNTLKLTYTANKEGFVRQAVITLQCMPASVFDFFVAGVDKDVGNDTIIYEMTFASKHACAVAPDIGPPAKVDEPSKLNGGEIFAIVLFSLIAAYIVFGMSFQIFVKNASGKEICPNHSFWCSLPIIKGACKSETNQGKHYDSI